MYWRLANRVEEKKSKRVAVIGGWNFELLSLCVGMANWEWKMVYAQFITGRPNVSLPRWCTFMVGQHPSGISWWHKPFGKMFCVCVFDSQLFLFYFIF